MQEFSDVRMSAEIEHWLRSLLKSERNPTGLEKKTVHHLFTTLKAIFKYSVKWGCLARSPMGNRDLKRVELPRGSTRRAKQPRSLTPAEFLDLVSRYGVMEQAAIATVGWLVLSRQRGFRSAMGRPGVSSLGCDLPPWLCHGSNIAAENRSLPGRNSSS